MLGGRRPEPEAIDETRLCWRRQRVQDLPHRGEIRAMEAVPVDLAVRNHKDDDLLSARDHRAEQRLPAVGRDLLRVVQQCERAHLVVAQAAVVEQHAGDDEWPREAAATGLVRAGHEACAELAVEPQELLAGAERHGRRE